MASSAAYNDPPKAQLFTPENQLRQNFFQIFSFAKIISMSMFFLYNLRILNVKNEKINNMILSFIHNHIFKLRQKFIRFGLWSILSIKKDCRSTII